MNIRDGYSVHINTGERQAIIMTIWTRVKLQMSETVQFRVSQQNMYECPSQYESRLSPACNPEKMNYYHSRTSVSVLASPVEILANRAPTPGLFRRSPHVLLSHKVYYAATFLTSWFPVAVRSMLAVTSLSVVIPSTELSVQLSLPSALSSRRLSCLFSHQSLTSVFPRHQSS